MHAPRYTARKNSTLCFRIVVKWEKWEITHRGLGGEKVIGQPPFETQGNVWEIGKDKIKSVEVVISRKWERVEIAPHAGER